VLAGSGSGGRCLCGACGRIAARKALGLVWEVRGAIGAAVLEGSTGANECVRGGAGVGLALSRRARLALLDARRDVAAAVAHVLSGPEVAGRSAAPLGRTIDTHVRGHDGAALGALAEALRARATAEASACAVRGVAARRAQGGVVPRVGAGSTATGRATSSAVEGVLGRAGGSVARGLIAGRARDRSSDGDNGRQSNERSHRKVKPNGGRVLLTKQKSNKRESHGLVSFVSSNQAQHENNIGSLAFAGRVVMPL
jgi:hypothetical protein